MEYRCCEGKCTLMKKILIILFTVGLLMFIGFGSATFFEAKKIANQPRTPLHYVKDYQKEDAAIKKLKVNSQLADVEVQRGKHFKVEAAGGDKKKTEVTSEIKDGTLIVKEKHKGSNINFNIGDIKASDITITVPDRMLETVELYNDSTDITVKGLKAKQATANASTGDIEFRNSDINQLNLVNDTGDIDLAKTHFKDVTAESDTGDITINSIKGDANIKADSDTGDIELNYTEPPQNTKLINHTDEDNGSEVRVNQPQLKAEKYGQGKYKVEVDTDTGYVEIN
ncbi:hypothetical protein CNQ82_00685 [Staphylococcus debuckii]|nr:hypothetical protein CNQ82_00685 [Staphylococcus debuckii]